MHIYIYIYTCIGVKVSRLWTSHTTLMNESLWTLARGINAKPSCLANPSAFSLGVCVHLRVCMCVGERRCLCVCACVCACPFVDGNGTELVRACTGLCVGD